MNTPYALNDGFLDDLRTEFLRDDGFFEDCREILSQIGSDPIECCQTLLKRTHGFKADAQAVGFSELGARVAHFEDLVAAVMASFQTNPDTVNSDEEEVTLSQTLNEVQSQFEALKNPLSTKPLEANSEKKKIKSNPIPEFSQEEDLLSGVKLEEVIATPTSTSEGEEKFQPKRYLLCALGEKHYGVPIEQVHEVLVERPINPLPLPIKNLFGVVNLRGRVLPLINLTQALDESEEANGMTPLQESQPRVIVVSGEGLSQFGVMVHAANTVVEINQRDMTPLDPASGKHAAIVAIADHNDSCVLCLDLKRISP